MNTAQMRKYLSNQLKVSHRESLDEIKKLSKAQLKDLIPVEKSEPVEIKEKPDEIKEKPKAKPKAKPSSKPKPKASDRVVKILMEKNILDFG